MSHKRSRNTRPSMRKGCADANHTYVSRHTSLFINEFSHFVPENADPHLGGMKVHSTNRQIGTFHFSTLFRLNRSLVNQKYGVSSGNVQRRYLDWSKTRGRCGAIYCHAILARRRRNRDGRAARSPPRGTLENAAVLFPFAAKGSARLSLCEAVFSQRRLAGHSI